MRFQWLQNSKSTRCIQLWVCGDFTSTTKQIYWMDTTLGSSRFAHKNNSNSDINWTANLLNGWYKYVFSVMAPQNRVDLLQEESDLQWKRSSVRSANVLGSHNNDGIVMKKQIWSFPWNPSRGRCHAEMNQRMEDMMTPLGTCMLKIIVAFSRLSLF